MMVLDHYYLSYLITTDTPCRSRIPDDPDNAVVQAVHISLFAVGDNRIVRGYC